MNDLTSGSAVVRAALEAAGWYPGYRHDTESWVRALRSAGHSVTRSGVTVMERLGGLEIVSPESDARVYAPYPLRIDPLRWGLGDADFWAERELQLGVKLCLVGDWVPSCAVLVAEDGRVFVDDGERLFAAGSDLADALRVLVAGERRPIEVELPAG